jgi:AMP-binding enzyme
MGCHLSNVSQSAARNLPTEVRLLAPLCRPMRNTRYYMLDPRSLQPCPVGVPGECYISGACVAMGYAGQPKLTAERFLPNPFKLPGDSHHYDRMYGLSLPLCTTTAVTRALPCTSIWLVVCSVACLQNASVQSDGISRSSCSVSGCGAAGTRRATSSPGCLMATSAFTAALICKSSCVASASSCQVAALAERRTGPKSTSVVCMMVEASTCACCSCSPPVL